MKRNVFVLFIAVFLLRIPVFSQDLQHFGNEKLVTFHGSLGATTYLYGIDGAPARRSPFSYVLNGAATLTIKGLALPFSFQYSDQQRDFRQPFNQFGVSPTYKWLKVHLGWRSVSFSHYTLDNHVFLGAGIEMNPGIFRFGAVYGRFQKAVQEDSTQQVYNTAGQYPIAAYNQYVYAIKMGIGSERNYVDLIYLNGKDDSTSVHVQPKVQQVQPGQNAVLGIKSHLTFFKKLTFDVDGAVSIYTRDLRADTLHIEGVGWQKTLGSFIMPRLSTNLYYAGDAQLQYREKQFGLAVKYNLVMPDYKSMGIYYLQTDLKRYTFSPYYNNKQNTIQATGSIGIEHDNIEAKKIAETQRVISSLNLNINPLPAFGLSLQYSNFGISQTPGLKSLTDTVVLDQVTQSILASPRYTLQRPDATHTFVYLFSDQTLNDRNKINSQNYNMTSVNNTFTYVLSLNKSGVSIDASAYYITTVVALGSGNSTGFSTGINKGFFKNNLLNTAFSSTYSSNTFEGAKDGYTLQMRLLNQININKKNKFKLDLTYTKNKSLSQAINQSFNEYLLTAMYGYTF